MNKEHTNFVTGVKFSPDNSLFISVGFDRKIVLYDAKDGSVKDIISQDKAEGAHTGAIISVIWLDNTSIATCSLDKSIKVWDISEKKLKYSLYPNDKSSLNVPETFTSINCNSTYLIGLTLNGKLNFWKLNELSDEQLPNIVIDGHQNYISNIVYKKSSDEIISSDSNGKISKFYLIYSYLE